MQRRTARILALCLVVTAAQASMAQEASQLDDADKAILSVFQMKNARVLCLSSPSSLPAIRKSVDAFLRTHGTERSANPDDVAKAAYTIFPCPFSPYREELRPATTRDVEGVWLFPEGSQKLRFGPKSPAWSQFGAAPPKCEAAAYYPEGEARNARVAGRLNCPFSSAKDMDVSRMNPKVASWQMIKDGVLKIARTDVQDHVEEWEVFAVARDFEVSGIQFKSGDLAAYLRKERGNDFNAATSFRYLQRLP